MEKTKTLELNRCTAEDLIEANIVGLDEKHIASLLEYRDEYGPFANWKDLKEVQGFNQDLVEKIQRAGAVLGHEEAELEDDVGSDRFRGE